MSGAILDPAELAARLIRRPSVTPKDEGALDIVAGTLEELGFTCHRLVFDEDGSEPIRNLYARRGEGPPNLCFAGHTDVVPTCRERLPPLSPRPNDISTGARPSFAVRSVC